MPTTRTRSDERIEFLGDVLVTAIEHAGYGFSEIVEWEPDGADAYAVVTDRYDEENPETTYRVDLDTIARGIGVINSADMRVDPKHEADGPVLHNSKTGQRLYLSPGDRKAILEGSRTNDAGELDVVLALAILECALFGAVKYN